MRPFLAFLFICPLICHGQIFSENWSSFPNSWSIQSGPGSTVSGGDGFWHSDTIGRPDSSAAIDRLDMTTLYNEWLISPEIILPSSQKVLLNFDFQTTNFWHVTPMDDMDMTIEITIDSGATWTPIWNEDSIHFNSMDWTKQYIDITGFQNDSIQLAFHYTGTKGGLFRIDNIEISEANPGVDLLIQDAYWHIVDSLKPIQYYMYPADWYPYQRFKADVLNLGLDTATNCTISTEVTGASAYTNVSLGSNVYFNDELSSTTDMNIMGAGMAAVDMFVSSDSTDVDSTNNLFKSMYEMNVGCVFGESDLFHRGDSLFGYSDFELDRDNDGIDDPYSVMTTFHTTGSFYSYATRIKVLEGSCSPITCSVFGEDSFGNISLIDADVPCNYNSWPPGEYYAEANINYYNPGGIYTYFHVSFRADIGDSLPFAYTYSDRSATTKIVFENTTTGFEEVIIKETPIIKFRTNCPNVVEYDFFNLSIYPNPAGEQITVEVTQLDSDAQINLYDISGKKIYSSTMVSGAYRLSFNLEDIAPGIYTLTIANQAGMSAKKVVVR
ncbi:MAG: hypothetical protein ACI9J3_002874 [Parvicellaceae bacterium]|jgi:hypothetical protein